MPKGSQSGNIIDIASRLLYDLLSFFFIKFITYAKFSSKNLKFFQNKKFTPRESERERAVTTAAADTMRHALE